MVVGGTTSTQSWRWRAPTPVAVVRRTTVRSTATIATACMIIMHQMMMDMGGRGGGGR